MQTRSKLQARRTSFMSILPTKVLVATDGSREAQLAAQTAADLIQKTNSELHVVHVFGIDPVGPPVYPEATTLQSVEFEAESDERQRISERGAREVLEAEVQKMRSGGGHSSWGASDRGTGGPWDRWVGRGARGRADSDGQQGTRRYPKSLDGQRL